MKAKGKNLLRISGVLEIIMGVLSILMLFWILKQDVGKVNFFGTEMAIDALWVLVYIYGTIGFKILAGLLGVILSNSVKHAKVCYILGIALIILQASAFGTIEFTVVNTITYIVVMIVPIMYFLGAAKNKNQ